MVAAEVIELGGRRIRRIATGTVIGIVLGVALIGVAAVLAVSSIKSQGRGELSTGRVVSFVRGGRHSIRSVRCSKTTRQTWICTLNLVGDQTVVERATWYERQKVLGVVAVSGPAHDMARLRGGATNERRVLDGELVGVGF
jgi:hypothetical protein